MTETILSARRGRAPHKAEARSTHDVGANHGRAARAFPRFAHQQCSDIVNMCGRYALALVSLCEYVI